MKVVLLLAATLFIAACGIADAPAPSDSDPNSPGNIAANAVGARQQATAAQAELNAANRRSAQATANSQATDNARAVAATATEAAFNLAVRKAQATDTAIAQHAQATQTAEAQHSQATATALAQDATARAANAAATADALSAQSTADAREVIARREIAQATTDAQRAAIEIAQTQAWAEVSMARDRRLSELVTTLCSLSSVVIFGICVVVLMGIAKWTEARWGNVTTRMVPGGMLVITGNMTTGYASRFLPAPGRVIDSTIRESIDDEPEDQPPEIEGQPGGDEEVLTPKASELRDTPERRLALKLLRHSMKLAGNDANVIPSAAKLGWPSETRQRAVNVIRPYLGPTIQGRGGGTFLGERYPTLDALFTAICTGRITLPFAGAGGRTNETVRQIESNSKDSLRQFQIE